MAARRAKSEGKNVNEKGHVQIMRIMNLIFNFFFSSFQVYINKSDSGSRSGCSWIPGELWAPVGNQGPVLHRETGTRHLCVSV